MKKLISTALMVIMLFSAIIAAFPIAAGAAYSAGSSGATANVPEGVTEANYSAEELAAYLENEYLMYDFDTAEEMLNYELQKGLLYYVNSAGNYYTIYINKYTGFVYYVNNVTGQILTSNPTNPGHVSEATGNVIQYDARADLMSQIQVTFTDLANSLNAYDYKSYQWAASRSQISISPIIGGLRVNYVLGDTTARFLLPGWITAESFEGNIIAPMLNRFEEMLEEYCSEKYPDVDFNFLENEEYEVYNEYGTLNFGTGMKGDKGLKTYFNDMVRYYSFLNGTAEYDRLDELRIAITSISGAYTVKNPARYQEEKYKSQLEKMHEEFPITKEGIAIYVYSSFKLNETKRGLSETIKKYCPDYTFTQMFKDEKECGYVDNSIQKPVIRCALEYTFNTDGSLSVRLPANSITFDETMYVLDTVTPLRHFGCADVTENGYIFYPDGSGTVVEFDDFYNLEAKKYIKLSLSSSIYGKDFAYSTIEGAHREQIIMPVYGIVNGGKANSLSEMLYGTTEVTDGFFAVLEEGASLATLGFTSGGAAHVYASTYASYKPYSSDIYSFSETTSSSYGVYKKVSEAKYTGAYVTRYVMLTDNVIGDKVYGKNGYYESSYVGMAAYYRNYLKDTGVLEALETVSEDLPLYIELLGSMEIIDRVLTFPVNKSIPLTTFEDAITIYEQLSNCKAHVQKQLDEYKQLLANEEDDNLVLQYTNKVEHYEQLLTKVEDTIDNINFKLTGFANGGVSYTYPTKVKWEKACGGKNGLATLVDKSGVISAESGKNFSVYPDFNFMYIVNTAPFDGISNKGNVSKMIDNRYASEQVYNAVTSVYESFFTLVINSEALDSLYTKFVKQYSKYGHTNLSVSTMGSALNSNFDEKAPVNREESREYVIAVLDRMVNEDGYELMVDTGNIYTLKYATHVLNLPIDSSHFRYSSYAVPFVGLVLHSYVSYTGAPLNYSGIPEYDLLRAIENGASLYYILCYQNTAHMKDDASLNKYYGVDYINWYDEIVTKYAVLNAEIGSLQSYEIVDHRVLVAERVIEEKENQVNTFRLIEEYLKLVDNDAKQLVADAYAYLRENHEVSEGLRVKFVADKAALVAQFAEIINVDSASLEAYVITAATETEAEVTFGDKLDEIIAKYTAEYPGNDAEGKSYTVTLSSVEYTSKYSYFTDSLATDKNYVRTDYTVDNGNVTMVTYKKGNVEVTFILNYNNYAVNVKIDAENTYTLEKHDFVKIVKEVQ